MKGLNPNLKLNRQKAIDLDVLKKGISNGNKAALSKGITLLESSKTEDLEKAFELLQWAVLNKKSSIRVGITGVPGAGKSTFIEALGMNLIQQGKKVAVLAIDPSSQKSKGSILGDKTRMENLSRHESSFIRPTASGSTLGGIAGSTREAMVLCEAAGYDVVFIETVGVGQSETAVKNMVDFFLLLLVSGAGDELQGMKRGIMEMANLILINKAEGENKSRALASKLEYTRAVSLYPTDESKWKTKVGTCSAVQNHGIDEAWAIVLKYISEVSENGFFDKNRVKQNVNWLEQTFESGILKLLHKNQNFAKKLKDAKTNVEKGLEDPMASSYKLLNDLSVTLDAT